MLVSLCQEFFQPVQPGIDVLHRSSIGPANKVRSTKTGSGHCGNQSVFEEGIGKIIGIMDGHAMNGLAQQFL